MLIRSLKSVDVKIKFWNQKIHNLYSLDVKIVPCNRLQTPCLNSIFSLQCICHFVLRNTCISLFYCYFDVMLDIFLEGNVNLCLLKFSLSLQLIFPFCLDLYEPNTYILLVVFWCLIDLNVLLHSLPSGCYRTKIYCPFILKGISTAAAN